MPFMIFKQFWKHRTISKSEDLFNTLQLVEDSIKENRYNLDAWLLKHEILNAIYNENSIRFDHYPELMLDASNFVLDRKKIIG